MMAGKEPIYFTDPDELVDFIIDKVGKDISFGAQNAIGKPNNIMNALYRRAKSDPAIKLRIITALTLEPPVWSNDLERRILEPIIERLWSGYIPLDYAAAARENKLPPNVEIIEFYYRPGAFLNNDYMQQNYISTNYTHAARDVIGLGMNVGGALISRKEINGSFKISLGCNGDMAMDILELLRKKERDSGLPCCTVGEVNSKLPFMYGDALSDPSACDAILCNPEIETRLFNAPSEPVDIVDHMIGLNASTLLKDDGTIQIGIGSLSDAIAYSLIVRHRHNSEYRDVVNRSGLIDYSEGLIKEWGGLDCFDKGLYACSEMFNYGILQMYKNNIMRRYCYDNIAIQSLVDDGVIDSGKITPEAFEALINNEWVHKMLSKDDFNMLVSFGVLKQGLTYDNGTIIDGSTRYSADFNDRDNIEAVTRNCLGSELKGGYWLHAGFFLGPQDFYDTVRAMPEEERKLINMTSVLNVNQLYSNNRYISEGLKVLHRRNGRFINTGMMATLSGAIVSDGLDNGKVLAGVGGQYNFVAMAHALSDGRSIIMVRSTRDSGSKIVSNIIFNYGHITIPRHLRDIVVTEYGLADIRGKCDQDIAKLLINIADSRFQEELLIRCKKAGKIPLSYKIPDRFRNNTPERLEKILAPARERGLYPAFPFGTDFTPDEIVIGKALRVFKAKAGKSKVGIIKDIAAQWFSPPPSHAKKYLERMQLDNPVNIKETFMQKIVVHALRMTGAI